ncbi:imidazole glycerol phosphate synthase subunit HisH [bacterium]|nr:imidazole glycerol phosphate synthase subunit HisH [bacterium]
MIAILNYDLGNLHSVRKAVSYVGGTPEVIEDPEKIAGAEKIILPGVGAFSDGMAGLAAREMVSPLQAAAEKGVPLLGICLGMQLLFDYSEEKGTHQGLGIIPGKVVPFTDTDIKIPQIGWNQLKIEKPSQLMDEIPQGSYVYFNHGYICVPNDAEASLTTTDYGSAFTSSVQMDNVYGVQFHPEKSQTVGLQILKNFVEL